MFRGTRVVDWRIAGWSLRLGDFGHPQSPFLPADSESAQEVAQNAPEGASGTSIEEAVPGSVQLKLRTTEATLYFRQGGLRVEADCRSDRRSSGLRIA
eukprot:5778166-Alexandrium_andersonii.AAC.1